MAEQDKQWGDSSISREQSGVSSTIRNKISRRSVLQLLSATSATGLAGCAGGGGNGGGGQTTGTASDNGWPNLQGTTVKFLSGEANQSMKKFYNMVKSDFESATDAKVKMTYGGGSSIDRTLIQMMQAGNPPELFVSGPDTLYQMILVDQAAPLTGVFEDWTKEWGDPISKHHHVNYQGKEWLIPWDVHATAFHYREDVWDVGPNKNGSHPYKWDEFLSGAKKAHDPNGMVGCYTGAGTYWCPQAILWGLGYSNGAKIGDWNNGDPQIVADDYRKEWIETLEFVKNLHNYSLAAADAECTNYVNAYVGNSASGTQYSGGRPKTSAVNKGLDWAGDARLQPVPYNTKKAVQGKPEGLITFKGSDLKGSRTYMRFLGTAENSAEYLKTFYKTAFGHVLPAFSKLNSGPWRTLAEEEMVGENKWHEEDLKALETIRQDREWMNTSRQDSLRQYHGPVWGSYALGTAQHNVLVNGADPAKEFDKAIPELRKALKEAKGQS